MTGSWGTLTLLALAWADPPADKLEAPPLLVVPTPPAVVARETTEPSVVVPRVAPQETGAARRSALPAAAPLSVPVSNATIPDTTVPDTTLPADPASGGAVEPPLDYRQATLERLQATLRTLAIANLPDRYVDEKGWNKTDRRIDGVDVTFYRGKFETRRKWKEVNNGLWKRYEIELVDPVNRLQASVLDVRLDEQGTPRFRMSLRAPLIARGQTAQWALGVQIFSLGAEATAEVELIVDGSCRIVPAATAFGPTLRLDPHVDAAALTLHSFHLDRIGKADGDFAEELGEALETLVRQQVESSGDRIAAKLNAAIDKRRDRLVLSLPEFRKSSWGDWLIERVPGLGALGEAPAANPQPSTSD